MRGWCTFGVIFFFFNLVLSTKDATFNEEEGYVRMFVRGRAVTLFAPSAVGANYSLAQVAPAPAQKPKLEWVYGYRGRDAR